MQRGPGRIELRHRLVLACVGVLIHCALPARILTDYLIYRTGLAGRLPDLPVPRWVVRAVSLVGLAGGLLFLPAVCAIGVYTLSRLDFHLLASLLASCAFTALLYLAVRRFNLTWSCVDRFDVGSARRLVGTCAVFQVFIGGNWRPHARQRCRRSVRTGCDWLEGKAREYGVELRFITDPADSYLLHDLKIAAGAWRQAARWQAYRREDDTAYQQIETLRPTLQQMVAERIQKLPALPDNICLIAHIPPRQVGFALPARNDLHMPTDFEVCVCGRKTGAAVYAHELLHLFGAPDLYFNPWWVLTRGSEADESLRRMQDQIVSSGWEVFLAYFGKSIMCQTAFHLDRLTVDPITARAIGWIKPDREFMKAAVSIERAVGQVIVDVIEKT